MVGLCLLFAFLWFAPFHRSASRPNIIIYDDFRYEAKQESLVRVESGKFKANAWKVGVAPILMVVVIIIVVLVGAIGVYFFFVSGNTSNTSSTHSSSLTTSSSQTKASSSASSVHATATSSARSTSTGASGISTYSGTFNFSLALGPSGVRSLSNYTVQTYSSVEVASGSFVFSIAATNHSGTGSGHGTLVVTTSGFCSGKTTVPYTFLIPDATTLLNNYSVFFSTPTPANYTVPLACTGPMTGVNTSTNNPASFLAVYPNLISAATIPVTVSQHLSGNISYYYHITQTS